MRSPENLFLKNANVNFRNQLNKNGKKQKNRFYSNILLMNKPCMV